MRNSSEYSYSQYNSIRKLYEDYNQRLRNYMIFVDTERVDEFDSMSELRTMNEEFRKSCDTICPNRDILCNIILDICYTRSSTKRFAWNMCGADIIHNLLLQNNHTIYFPTIDKDGDIEYCCNRFSVISTKVEVKEWE